MLLATGAWGQEAGGGFGSEASAGAKLPGKPGPSAGPWWFYWVLLVLRWEGMRWPRRCVPAREGAGKCQGGGSSGHVSGDGGVGVLEASIQHLGWGFGGSRHKAACLHSGLCLCERRLRVSGVHHVLPVRGDACLPNLDCSAAF